MRGTDICRTYARPLRIEPHAGQVTEHDVESAAVSPPKRGDILHEDVTGSKVANSSGEVCPQVSLVLDAASLAGL